MQQDYNLDNNLDDPDNLSNQDFNQGSFAILAMFLENIQWRSKGVCVHLTSINKVSASCALCRCPAINKVACLWQTPVIGSDTAMDCILLQL